MRAAGRARAACPKGLSAAPKEKGLTEAKPLSFQISGAGKRSRTPDLRITNALLYLLSYTGIERRII